MVELVDTQDLKSCECKLVRVQVPLLVHFKPECSNIQAFLVLAVIRFYGEERDQAKFLDQAAKVGSISQNIFFERNVLNHRL